MPWRYRYPHSTSIYVVAYAAAAVFSAEVFWTHNLMAVAQSKEVFEQDNTVELPCRGGFMRNGVHLHDAYSRTLKTYKQGGYSSYLQRKHYTGFISLYLLLKILLALM